MKRFWLGARIAPTAAAWILLTRAAAAQSPAPSEAAAKAFTAAVLPEALSPWGMFVNADIVVKGVMIGLIVASVITWTVWLAKSLELIAANRRARDTLRRLEAATTLTEAAGSRMARRGPADALIQAAQGELQLSTDAPDKAGVKERVGWRLDRIMARAARRIGRGTGVLATIGATAPFVGLFGTVWGIMNSFIGISQAQTTNLAIVAPGIAEALLATGMGLVAAIPAVVAYNLFARSIGGYKSTLADAASEVMRLVSRDLDRPRLRDGAARPLAAE
jgi:biopolymer transport protein ExbB